MVTDNALVLKDGSTLQKKRFDGCCYIRIPEEVWRYKKIGNIFNSIFHFTEHKKRTEQKYYDKREVWPIPHFDKFLLITRGKIR